MSFSIHIYLQCLCVRIYKLAKRTVLPLPYEIAGDHQERTNAIRSRSNHVLPPITTSTKSMIPPLELQIQVQAFPQPSIYLVKFPSQHSLCETARQTLEIDL